MKFVAVLSTFLLGAISSYMLQRYNVGSLLGTVLSRVVFVSTTWPRTMASDSNTTPTSSGGGEYSMAFVTVPNMEVGKKIAGGLVSNKLAACVNIIPGVTSVYEWEGKIENDSELILMIKTRTSLVTNLTDFVTKNHPYDVAEVISSPIDQGNKPYLDWIGKTVKTPPSP